MRYISELIDENRKKTRGKDCVLLKDRRRTGKQNKVNILALGDVGGTVLTGMRLLGEGIISRIGIYDVNEKMMRRYEREVNQIRFPDGRRLPYVEILSEDKLFDCDMFVFCASKGVPPLGASGDVRMAQLKANCSLVSLYAGKAAAADFSGIFAVVSDPVDPLCKAALMEGLDPGQIQG